MITSYIVLGLIIVGSVMLFRLFEKVSKFNSK